MILHNITIGTKNRFASVICSNVLIGTSVVLLGKVNIGEGAIIGVNSVVLHDVNDNDAVAGNPIRLVKSK